MIRAALLQQTRLSDKEHKKLEQGFCYYAYSLSQRSGHCRDLAILISQQICFEYLFDIRDRDPIGKMENWWFSTHYPQYIHNYRNDWAFDKLMFELIWNWSNADMWRGHEYKAIQIRNF